MGAFLFLQQNTAKPDFYHLSPNCRIFAFFGLVGVLGRFRSSIGTQSFIGAYTGRKEEYIRVGCDSLFL